jgi:hypothetical protein
MIRVSLRAMTFALVAMPLAAFGANAQLAVSANDGKAILVDGVTKTPANPPADYVAIIDLGVTPPPAFAALRPVDPPRQRAGG